MAGRLDHLPVAEVRADRVAFGELAVDAQRARLARPRLAPPLALDGEGFRPTPATAPFGADTRAILAELGFSEDDVTRLVAARVTRDGFSTRQ